MSVSFWFTSEDNGATWRYLTSMSWGEKTMASYAAGLQASPEFRAALEAIAAREAEGARRRARFAHLTALLAPTRTQRARRFIDRLLRRPESAGGDCCE